MLVWMLRLQVLVLVVEVRKLNRSFLLANAVSQSRQPCNVLRVSQETDVFPAQVPQSERDDWTYS